MSIGYGHVVTYLGFTSGVITPMLIRLIHFKCGVRDPCVITPMLIRLIHFKCGVRDLCFPCAPANYVDGTRLVSVPHTVTVISWFSVEDPLSRHIVYRSRIMNSVSD